MNPLQQGLKLPQGVSYNQLFYVAIMNPLQQGLKPSTSHAFANSIIRCNNESTTTRIETDVIPPNAERSIVAIMNPLQQGLKRYGPT